MYLAIVYLTQKHYQSNAHTNDIKEEWQVHTCRSGPVSCVFCTEFIFAKNIQRKNVWVIYVKENNRFEHRKLTSLFIITMSPDVSSSEIAAFDTCNLEAEVFIISKNLIYVTDIGFSCPLVLICNFFLTKKAHIVINSLTGIFCTKHLLKNKVNRLERRQ